jgi:hypothetical protein
MFARLAQGSLKSHFAQRALLLSFSNHSRTDSWSFSIVEGLLLHHETQQSMTLHDTHQLQHCMSAHSGGCTWRSSGAPSKNYAATLLAAIPANLTGMTRYYAQNERVVFINKLSITTDLNRF